MDDTLEFMGGEDSINFENWGKGFQNSVFTGGDWVTGSHSLEFGM